LVSSQTTADGPQPPPDLEAPECELWYAITAEWRGTPTSFHMLADALRTHARARECAAVVAEEGLQVSGRDNQPRAHPLLAAERSALASYHRQLKLLGIKY
jgi:hypothetical protein